MAGSVNKVILIGNVGKDPEIRTTNNGSRLVNMSVATSESWKDKATGERKENTQWHRVVVFNEQLVGVIERFVKKGSKVYLEGQLETRKWTDTEGKDNYSTEVVLRPYSGQLTMLDSRGSSEGGDYTRSSGSNEAPSFNSPAASGGYAADLDDDIPF